jgi:hypothetical protein
MSRLVRLAQLLAIKYGLESRAAVPVNEDRIVAETKRDVRDAYRNYFSRSARDSMFQYAADLGEPMSVELVKKMDKLVVGLDKITPQKLMSGLNEVLSLMYQMKTDPERGVRNAIHDSAPAGTEAQRNTRQRLLSKYERSISMAFPALQKAAVRLQVIVPDMVQGGNVERQRADLSKQQLMDFVMNNPAFRTYGVNSLDVMEQFLSDPDLKHRLITLINAVNRGHLPLDAPAVIEFAQHIRKWLDSQQQTNQPELESEELPSPAEEGVE